MKSKTEHIRSSGNVFADLGLPDADERMLKAQLAVQIRRFIEEKGLTQSKAAEAVGLDQPKVSHLLHGRLAGFSVWSRPVQPGCPPLELNAPKRRREANAQSI